MKKTLILFTMFSMYLTYGQEQNENQLEKTVTGVQLGLFGANLYNESRLASKIVLRSEISLNLASIWGGDLYPKTGFVLYSQLTVLPKYYYNISDRVKRGKNVKNNSGNYIGLEVSYVPGNLTISNYDNMKTNNVLQFIPTYGIRRNFATNFNYEVKLGLGYGLNLDTNVSGMATNLGVKIGYDF